MASLSERSGQRIYEIKQRRIKRAKRVLSIAAVIAVIASVLFYIFFEMNRTFCAVSEVTSVERTDGSSTQYMTYNGQILKYSKDGACATKYNGEILWNDSFEFKNPKAVTCGKYVAIADIGEKQICVFDGGTTGTMLTVDSAIVQVAVAKQGVVAAVLENDDEARINIYDPYDKTEQLKVSISTSTDSDGYPVAIALSPDGQKLVTSYITISGGVVTSSLNFYNFAAEGQENVDRIVGSRPLNEEIVANVEFVDSNTVCAFTENGCKWYELADIPKDVADIKVKETIRSVCHNSKYVCMVLDNENVAEKPYIVRLYNMKGKKVLEKEVDYQYDTVEMGDEEVIFYSDMSCYILRKRGSEKLRCDFAQNISYFLPERTGEKYVMITGDKIMQVKLEGRYKGE